MADGEHTGGMLALVPDRPQRLAIDGGEDPSELHLTLLYLGDDVAEWGEGQADRLRELVAASAPALDAVDARIIGPALFNPDGGPDGNRDPCLVLIVADSPELNPLRKWAQWVTTTHDDYPDPPEQFEPFLPHITVAVAPEGEAGVSADGIYTGPVRFSTLRLALAGDVYDYPLGQEAPVITETKTGEITFTPPQHLIDAAMVLPGPVARVVAEGKALNSRGVDWVAENCGTEGAAWAAEMRARAGEIQTKSAKSMNMGKRVTSDGDADDDPALQSIDDLHHAINTHHKLPPDQRRLNARRLKGAAKRLGADHHVRQRVGSLETATTDGSGAKSLEPGVEVKLMSPDPRAEKLRNYWAHNPKGVAKWKPGAPGSFRRLRRHLAKYVHSPRVLNGLTANVFKQATGIYPGQRPRQQHKSLAPGALAAAVAETTGAEPSLPARLTVDCFALFAPGAEVKAAVGGALSARDAQRGALDDDQISVERGLIEFTTAGDASTPIAVHGPAGCDVHSGAAMVGAGVKSAPAGDDTSAFVLSLGDRFEVVGPYAVTYAAEVEMIQFKSLADRTDEQLPDDTGGDAGQVRFGHVDQRVALFVQGAGPQPMPVGFVDVGEKSLRPGQARTGGGSQGDSASPSGVVHSAVPARAVLRVASIDTARSGHEHKAILQAADREDDEAALHAGVNDWGEIFAESWTDGYLAALENEFGDEPDDAPSDDSTNDVIDTARHASIGARMVVDDTPASSTSDVPETGSGTTTVDDSGATEQAQLFDAEPAGT